VCAFTRHLSIELPGKSVYKINRKPREQSGHVAKILQNATAVERSSERSNAARRSSSRSRTSSGASPTTAEARAILTLTGYDTTAAMERKTVLTKTSPGFQTTGVLPIDRILGIIPEARQTLTTRDVRCCKAD
jgi:hypothetical protein